MKKVEGIITAGCPARFVDHIVAVTYACGWIEPIGFWEIFAENDIVGHLVHVIGYKPIVRFLEFITDFRGKNLSSWKTTIDENGEIKWIKSN